MKHECPIEIDDTTASAAFSSQNDYLTDTSPENAIWDVQRAYVDAVGGIYASALEFEHYAVRMSRCSGLLRFAHVQDEGGAWRLALREARFCRVRHCPVCQWRRSLMWKARFYQAIPELVERYPTARWLYLTVTIRNCEIGELGATLSRINEAWGRMTVRKKFRLVLGWVRSTEVTRGISGDAHPHCHVLLMVEPSYFAGRNYISQKAWRSLWRESLRIDYDPMVHIQTVKSPLTGNSKPELKSGQTRAEAVTDYLRGSVKETLKYSTKPADMVADDAWFHELTRQMFHRRFISAGGVLKGLLKAHRETEADLVSAGEPDKDDDGSRLAFSWRTGEKRYRRARKFEGP